MLELVENNHVDPVCPHCEQALRTVNFREIRSMLGKLFIYFCPSCRKVLGVSHRKGFWMG